MCCASSSSARWVGFRPFWSRPTPGFAPGLGTATGDSRASRSGLGVQHYMNEQTILPAAVRAHTVEQTPPASRSSATAAPWPDLVVILDTETTLDRTQRLTFGSYHVWDGERLVEEGLFGADELSPAQWAVLEEYAARHTDANGHPLKLYRRRAILAEVFWRL